MQALLEKIRGSIIGDRAAIETPFGRKPLVYADYTASGRALSFVEDFIREEVLPWYANTHTETSFTGARTTALREAAREEIRRAVRAGDSHRVIFCGSGATAAINRLIDSMGLRRGTGDPPPEAQRPVVFVGPYEHHSNELPWRESIARVVPIPAGPDGGIDTGALERELTRFRERPLLIGSFSAASNVTGIKSDVAGISALLKSFGALAFWDYAAAAPYVDIDMTAPTELDAVFISPHKFIGGPGTPGVLVARQSLFSNAVPAVSGGGTVLYVTPEDHRYVTNIERREEGGTPGIVESIRAGLVFRLRREVGIGDIQRREEDYARRALERLGRCENLSIVGDTRSPRLPILSLRFRHGERDLHYGFIVALLNDLFGIQARGGCSCAGPYGHSLLGMDMDYSRALESELLAGRMLLRPGWVRLNFNYFITETEFEYLLTALELVARHGWRLLPAYRPEMATGVWQHQSQQGRRETGNDPLAGMLRGAADSTCRQQIPLQDLQHFLEEARCTLAGPLAQQYTSLPLPPSAEKLRWFVLPQEIATSAAAS